MVLLFITFQQGQPNFISTPKEPELLAFLDRLTTQGHQIAFSSTHEYHNNLKGFGSLLGWTDLGSRDKNDLGFVWNVCSQYMNSDTYVIILASYEEVEAIRQAYKLEKLVVGRYDVLMIYAGENGLVEVPTFLDETYKPEIGLWAQVQQYLTREIPPLITEYAVEIVVKSRQIFNNAESLKGTMQACLETGRELGRHQQGRKTNGAQMRLSESLENLKAINSHLSGYSEKSDKISKKLELIPNEAGYSPEKEVKYASIFSEGQIELTETQSPDHSMHLITIRNTTHYHWDSLSLLMPQIESVIQSNINLKPLETINLEVDYRFEQIQSHGVISMKVLLGRITISNEVFISRIIMSDLKQNGNVYELHAKNQGMVINDCKIYWAGKDGQWRNLNTQFPNFSSRRIAIQGLIRGEEYVFLAYNRENLAISPQLSFVA